MKRFACHICSLPLVSHKNIRLTVPATETSNQRLFLVPKKAPKVTNAAEANNRYVFDIPHLRVVLGFSMFP
ncbi:MAG: hypothetical protein QY318_04870 [Candidatus Dojkabacteria bacterium]|nr:MAG: hypothetical protein QY318_04870 [Candidatus Dojkabacteria bacterium]